MRLFVLLLGCHLAWTVAAADKSTVLDTTLVSSRHTNATPLFEGDKDADIVRVVASLLQSQHYLQMRINDDVSSKFLDRYLDSLDSLHIYFTQSDLKEFEKYREHLDELTTKAGDTTPARVIFNRFRERLLQQYEYVEELLKEDKFEFTGNDRFVTDRKKMQMNRPRDLAEARELWKNRLRYEYLQEKLNKVEPSEIVTNLTKRYTRVLRMLNEYDNGDALQIYLTALARVFDPHSDYMGKSEFDNFSIGMKLSLFGIGALLRSEDGICKIVSLTDGGPAQNSKLLKADDKIIAVAQSNQPPVDVVDMKLSKVVEQIRGDKGTEVRLTIIPADAPNSSVRKVISLIRDEIKLDDSAAKARIFELPFSKNAAGADQMIRLGVIDLPSFYSGSSVEGRRNGVPQKSTTVDVAKLVVKLKQEKVAGIILDLRNNGGGLLDEAINLTGLFIKDGPVVQVKDYDGRVYKDEDTDSSVLYDGPLIVLTSRFSASASEILAGALQDYGRALIVGDSSTHGKGTVQSLLDLAPIMRRNAIFMTNNPGAVKVTIRKFYRASGASTQLKGVTPDIILPSVNNHIEVGEASLENPMEWDTIQPASYEKINRVEPYLADLKKRSGQRISTDKDFAYVRDDIERFKKLQADKSVSLNEAVRLEEKKEEDERAKARKQERAARPEPPGNVYDIPLKLVDQPGLPAPTVRTNLISSVQDKDKASHGDITKTTVPTTKEIKPARSPKDSTPVVKDEKPALTILHKDGEDEEEFSTPAVDVTLEEAKKILMDYALLLSNGKNVAVIKPDLKP